MFSSLFFHHLSVCNVVRLCNKLKLLVRFNALRQRNPIQLQIIHKSNIAFEATTKPHNHTTTQQHNHCNKICVLSSPHRNNTNVCPAHASNDTMPPQISSYWNHGASTRTTIDTKSTEDTAKPPKPAQKLHHPFSLTTKWTKMRILHVLTHMSCSFSMQNSWICTLSKLLGFSSQFCGVLIFDLKRIAGKLEATTVVLQSRQPWHSNSTLSYPVLLAFPYKRAWKRNKGIAENHAKSLV